MSGPLGGIFFDSHCTLVATTEACQSFQEISLTSGLLGKRTGRTWWSERWPSSTSDSCPEGKVRYDTIEEFNVDSKVEYTA